MNEHASPSPFSRLMLPLSDPSELETFDPRSKRSAQELIPIGTTTDENGDRRTVGVPRGGAVDPDWSLVTGVTRSGKSQLIINQMLAVAQAGEGFLYFNPNQAEIRRLKEYLGDHATRVFELNMSASDGEGPVTVGWNPLDVTVVPESERASYIETLAHILPEAFFPSLCEEGAPQTRMLITKALLCLLTLNRVLPPEMQTNIFCMARLLSDEEWRAEVLKRVPSRQRKWWVTDFNGIVGDEGDSTPALRPILNTLCIWESDERVFGMLGSSLSTIRWKEIMNSGGIVLMSANGGTLETVGLVTRLMYHEITTAFRSRSYNYKQEDIQPFHSYNYKQEDIQPFHLFVDDLPSSDELVRVAPDFMAEFRKYGAKGHFVYQSIRALPEDYVGGLVANLTHVFMGHPGSSYLYEEDIMHLMGVAGPDAQDMNAGDFLCKIDSMEGGPALFAVESIDLDIWNHLRSIGDISGHVAENSGLVSVRERCRHIVTLPERIEQWLRNGEALTVDEVIDSQVQGFQEFLNEPEDLPVVAPDERDRPKTGRNAVIGAALLVIGFLLGRRSR